MLLKESKLRFEKQLDVFFWFFVQIVPLLAWLSLFINYHGMDIPDIFSYVMSFSPFTYIDNLFSDVFSTVFGASFGFTHYLSYLVGVEVCHVFFDVIAFLPRLCHKLVNNSFFVD